MKQHPIFPVVLAIIGILLFSSKAVMVKLGYQFGVDAVTLLLLRMAFSLPFYLVIALFKRPELKPTPRDFMWLLFFGVIGYYLSSYLDFSGLQYIKAGLERLILFSYPTIVLLLSWLFFNKTITRQQGLGVLITYLGVILIFVTELSISESENVLFGGGLIFLSAITYASYLVGTGWLIPRFGATLFTSYAMIVSCVCVFIHFTTFSDIDLLSLPTEVYGIGLAMAIFATVIPSFLISYAIKQIGPNRFSTFGSLGPVSTIVLAYFFLDESLNLLQLLGAVVVIGGILLAEKRSTPSKM